MHRLILVVILAILPAISFATDYGRWFCPECGPDMNIDQVTVFVRSNQITNRWKLDDLITVCDGISCGIFGWTISGWYPKTGLFRDTKAKYKNSGNTNVSVTTDVNFPTYSISTTGHWEWWDYYSNGEFTGSDDLQWVYDSISIMTNGHVWVDPYRNFEK